MMQSYADDNGSCPHRQVSANAEQPDLGPLEDSVGFHLRRAWNAALQLFSALMGEEDLGPGHCTALILTYLNPGITQMTLSRAIGRDKSTLTPILRQLESRGLIARRRMPSDRRRFTITVTDSGEKKVQELLAQSQLHNDTFARLIGPEKKAELIELLRHISISLDNARSVTDDLSRSTDEESD